METRRMSKHATTDPYQDIRDAVRRKRQALVAHHSQIGPDWPMLAIP